MYFVSFILHYIYIKEIHKHSHLLLSNEQIPGEVELYKDIEYSNYSRND